MKPAPFDYVRPETLREALEILAEAPQEARVLAGGQSLMAMLNMRLANPRLLIDIMRLKELRVMEERKGAVVIGAGVRQAELERWPQLDERLPLVHAALPWIGHRQTRSRGTVCGSIAHADPSAELPLCLLALGGIVRLRSRRRTRELAADQFIVGMMATALGDGELLESVSLPVREPGTGYAFREIGRRHGDFAIVACAAVVGDRTCRLAVGGVADRPMLRELPPPSDSALDDALNDYAWSLNARDDLHASARYRRELVRRMGRATIEEAHRCRA